jgi:hypothetical protein
METIHPSDTALHPRRLVSSTRFPDCVIETFYLVKYAQVISDVVWIEFPLPDD